MSLINRSFYFVRHGPTIWNAKRLCQGVTDVPLSEEGIRHAMDFSNKIAQNKMVIEGIVTSPLKRAFDTATFIQSNSMPSPSITVIEGLKERAFGNLEGISSEQMYQIEKEEEKNSEYNPGNGVESRAACRKRIKSALHEALLLHEKPLLVSHGRVFMSLCEVLNLPIIRQIPNLTLIKFEQEKACWSMDYVNL